MTARFVLDCTDCRFRTTVTGEFTAALAAVEAHREERGAASDGHFVNLHASARPPPGARSK